MRRQSFFTLCYLDDFIGIEPTREKVCQAYNVFLEITRDPGLDLALEKCFPPTQELVWLRFNIDSANMIITIPQRRLLKS